MRIRFRTLDGYGELFGVGSRPTLTDGDFVRIYIEGGRLGVSITLGPMRVMSPYACGFN